MYWLFLFQILFKPKFQNSQVVLITVVLLSLISCIKQKYNNITTKKHDIVIRQGQVDRHLSLQIDTSFRLVNYPNNLRTWGPTQYQQFKNDKTTLDLSFYNIKTNFKEDSTYYNIANEEIKVIFKCNQVLKRTNFSSNDIKGYLVESPCPNYCKVFIGYNLKELLLFKFVLSETKHENLLENLVNSIEVKK